MNREIKFELIWDNGTPKRIVTLDEINEMGEEFKTVAYIRQWTGFLDKESKEIFEGNIVKWHLSNAVQEKDMEIHFEQNSCSFKVGNMSLNEYRASVIEVIGDVLENPNLLTPKD